MWSALAPVGDKDDSMTIGLQALEESEVCVKKLMPFVLGLALAGLLVGLFVIDIPLSTVAAVAAGVVCLGWLVVIVVLPWNLHFQARHLSLEIERARARGIAVDDRQALRARLVGRRTLRISLALHLVSGALLAGGSWLYAGSRSDEAHVGYAFAACSC